MLDLDSPLFILDYSSEYLDGLSLFSEIFVKSSNRGITMYKALLTVVCLSFLYQPLSAEDTGVMTGEARGIVMGFGKSLKKELVTAMKAGGPVKAVGVCNTLAPEIAATSGEKSGWEVGRTSLKLRNTDNMPDSWELAVLNDFEARKAAGEDITKMEYTEVIETAGKKEFRYMKAIPTGKPCMACHASEINPGVEAVLSELYPADKARGFKPGDIRGAFTLKKNL